jgi:hypothetical protein
VPRAILLSSSLRRALEGGSADECGRFRIDQLLVERLGRGPDVIGDIGEFQWGRSLMARSDVMLESRVPLSPATAGTHLSSVDPS